MEKIGFRAFKGTPVESLTTSGAMEQCFVCIPCSTSTWTYMNAHMYPDACPFLTTVEGSHANVNLGIHQQKAEKNESANTSKQMRF